jgi:hypothetical protein
MTRETKVGLIIAGSFLSLVCIVVVSKMQSAETMHSEPEEQSITVAAHQANESKKENPAKPQAPTSAGTPATPAGPGPSGLPAPVPFQPLPLDPGALPQMKLPSAPEAPAVNSELLRQKSIAETGGNPGAPPLPNFEASQDTKGTGGIAGLPPALPGTPPPAVIPSKDGDKKDGLPTKFDSLAALVPPPAPNSDTFGQAGTNPQKLASAGSRDKNLAPLQKADGVPPPIPGVGTGDPGGTGKGAAPLPPMGKPAFDALPPMDNGAKPLPVPSKPPITDTVPPTSFPPPPAMKPLPAPGAGDPPPFAPLPTTAPKESSKANGLVEDSKGPPMIPPGGPMTVQPPVRPPGIAPTMPAPPTGIAPMMPAPPAGIAPPPPTIVGKDAPSVPPIATIPGPGSEPNLSRPTMPGNAGGSFPVMGKPAPTARMTEPDLYECKPGDTNFAVLSKQFYGDTRYTDALIAYNRKQAFMLKNGSNLMLNPPLLQAGQQVVKPNVNVLEADHGTLIAAMTEPNPLAPVMGKAPPVKLNAPSPLSQPPAMGQGIIPATAGAPGQARTYMVRNPQGENIIDIAERVLGDRTRWHEIYRINPNYQPQTPIPPGTTLQLPGN